MAKTPETTTHVRVTFMEHGTEETVTLGLPRARADGALVLRLRGKEADAHTKET